MGLLDERMRRVQQEQTAMPEPEIPEYSLGVDKIKKKKKKKRKRAISGKWIFIFVITALLAAAIYIPPLFNPDTDVRDMVSRAVAPDVSALVTAHAVLSNNPDGDFDGDGLSNELEARYGTNPYSIDSDGDGITDYAELFIIETNPRITNNGTVLSVENIIRDRDEAAGRAVNTPIKIHNVVLWADDYASRVRSGVVRTVDGYRICNFKGWAQFPENEVPYALINGYHVPMQQNSQGYYRLDGGDTTIKVFDRPLEMTNELTLFGSKFHIGNWFGDFLSFILPSRGQGPLTSRNMAVMDIEGRTRRDAIVADIKVPESLYLPDSRFERNHNRLTDLASVMQAIYEGDCVIVSLYSPANGEAIVLAYGYTFHGNLLVADIETGAQLGAINITELAGRFLDMTGELQQYEWFIFSGCGFSSVSGDRIAFILPS